MFDLTRLTRFALGAGSHKDPDDGLCAMEAVAWLEGLAHSDRPDCTCPVIAEFVRGINDTMPAEERQRLIPFLPRLAGTVAPGHVWARAEHLARHALQAAAPVALGAIGLHAEAVAVRRAGNWVDAARAAQAAADTAEAVVAAAWEGSLALRAARHAAARLSTQARDIAVVARRNAYDAHHAALVAGSAARAAGAVQARDLGQAAWAATTAITCGVAYRGDWDTDLRLLADLLRIGAEAALPAVTST